MNNILNKLNKMDDWDGLYWMSSRKIALEIINYIAFRLNNNDNGICVLKLSTMETGGVTLLSKALQKNIIVTIFDINGNFIGDNEVLEVAKMIKVNRTITKLHLGQNCIRSIGMQSLAESLNINDTLVYLNLENNLIGHEGVKYLCSALTKNKTLTTLILKNNNLNDDATYSISKALEINRTLTHLSLAYNSIGNMGLEFLVDAVNQNNTLLKLDLEYNKFNSCFETNIFGYASIVKLTIVPEELATLNKKLNINQINKNRLVCLQTLCINKIKEIGMDKTVKEIMPVVYESSLEKNKVCIPDQTNYKYNWQKEYFL
jgi:hypothetical protein